MTKSEQFCESVSMLKSNNALGERVKQFRLMNEWTQADTAKFFRISMATYVRVESGKSCGDLTRAKIENKLEKQTQAA